MRKLVLAAIVASAFFACTGPSASDMKKQNDSLYMVSIEKDRQMNELIGALVEIDDNLQQIKEKENVIALNAKRKDNTSSANVKEKINNDIKAIYDLMLKNKERIAELEKKLQTGNKNNESLRKLVVRLNKQLESKAVEIAALEEELKKKHIQIQHMNFTIDGLQHALDSIHAKTLSTERKLEETTEELYRAYYAFGTRKELKEQRKSVEKFAREYVLMANDCIVQFKDKSAAIANLNKAVELNPGFFDAILRRADIRVETGEYKKAEKDYMKAVTLNKRSFKEINDLLNKNGYEINMKIQHGFGDFHEVIFKKKQS